MKKIIILFLFAFLLIGSVSLSAQLTDVVHIPNGQNSWGIALKGDTLYIGTTSGNIYKMNKNDENPPLELVASGLGVVKSIAIHGNNLYAGGSINYIYRVDVSQNNPTKEIFVTTDTETRGLYVENNELYFSYIIDGVVNKVDLTQSAPIITTVVSGVDAPEGIVSVGDFLYVVEYSNTNIVKFDLSSPNPVKEVVISGVTTPFALIRNGNFIYFTKAGAIGRFDALSPNPTVETIQSGLSGPRFCAFDGLNIFIAEADAHKISKLTIEAPVFSNILPVCFGTTPDHLGGASPTGGVYSGPGVTDNGDGNTFTFDAAAAGGVGTHTITYSLGQAVTTTLEVVALPTVTFTASADIQIDAGVQMNLSGGTPVGGTYSGTGVTDNGDGTYNFDPMTAGIGMHTITYAFTDTNDCGGSSTDDISVTAIAPPGDDCMESNDINNLFGAAVGEVQTSQLWDNTNATGATTDPMTGLDCFFESSLNNTIWYTFTGDGNSYNIKNVICNATTVLVDMQGAVFTGGCGALTEVACNEDEDVSNNIFNFNLDFDTEDGVTYYLMLDGTVSSGVDGVGEYCLEVTQFMIDAVIDINKTNIEIFPNPTTGILQLSNVEAEVVEVFDNTGRLVKTVSQAGNSMDISELPTGFYFLKIFEGEEVYSAKVVKK